LKDITPSEEVIKWFSRDPPKRNEFKQKYFQELDHKKELVSLIIQKAMEEKFNNGIVLKKYIETTMG